MKSKEEINQLAEKIFQLEQKIQANPLVKTVKGYMREIEIIMESCSLDQLMALNEAVEDRLK